MTAEEMYAMMGTSDPSQSEGHIAPAPAPMEPPSTPQDDLYQQYLATATTSTNTGADPTIPLSEPAAPQPPARTVDVKAGGSASASSSGYSEGRAKQVQRTSGNALDRRINNDQAIVEQKGARDVALLDGAERNQADAIHQQTVAQNDADIEDSRLQTGLADKSKWYAQKEQEEVLKSQARVEQAKAGYEQRLAEFNAAQVNPNQLFQSMGKGDQFGTLVSVFVHDFLGAKGIKTSAMDTLNKAIDRNIDAQIQNINNKGKVAEGFRNLWDMERAQSASDAEARARVRTYFLESAKQGVQAEMLRFRTGLNDANGAAAIAKLNAESVKAKLDAYHHMDQNELAMRGQEIQRYGDEVRAAQEATRIQIARNAEAREARKEAAAKQAFEGQGLLQDPVTGEYTHRIKQELGPEERKKVREMAVFTAQQNADVSEYMKLLAAAKASGHANAGWTDIGRFTGQDEAKIRALHSRILSRQIKIDSGLTATEQEVQRKMNEIPLNKSGTVADVEKLVAGYARNNIDQYHAMLRYNADPVMQGDSYYGQKAPDRGVAERARAEYDGLWTDTGNHTTANSQPTQAITRPDAMNGAKDTTVNDAIDRGVNVNTEWESYTKSKPGTAPPVPAAAVGVMELAKNARETRPDGQPTADAIHAREQLKSMAEGYIPVGDDKSQIADPNSPRGKLLRDLSTYELAQLSGITAPEPTFHSPVNSDVKTNDFQYETAFGSRK